ncbi:RNA polymerase factor sigma-54 [Paenibacillus sp.]|uniref:RNA polymerase factor sigma-54 n=1 Tax=Paenibacillus sp. TaxID=58172 RepID=UPI002D30A8AC|nr:RNA polymerase factor sigma-54 [Paenibacillus sp.]HZG86369.1 RNA polymerase factor sigma-54 [Paenibacillus sp.]
MHAGYALTQTLAAKLRMTPLMQQSIHVLQLSAADLADYLQEQATDNPLLELEWPEPPARSASSAFAGEDDWIGRVRMPGESLEQSLLSQLRVKGVAGELYRIARFLVGSLNEYGYLTVSVADAAATCRATAAEVEAALREVQSLEPAGVGARDLRECLLLQIARDPDADRHAAAVAAEYLEAIAHGRRAFVARRLGIAEERLERTLAYIRSLRPRPVLPGDGDSPRYVEPDAAMWLERGEVRFAIADGGLPRLGLNAEYVRMLRGGTDREAAAYLRACLQRANQLRQSVERRQSTLLKVVAAIAERQADFVRRGALGLKPLTLRDVAEAAGMHESTVSRATRGKYAQTPYGLYELKYFFTTGLRADDGSEASAASVKAKIRAFIEEEPRDRPLSDQWIANALNAEGIRISRRTVMKYREEMGILSSRMRG